MTTDNLTAVVDASGMEKSLDAVADLFDTLDGVSFDSLLDDYLDNLPPLDSK